jgi:hypothetical protein
MGMKNLSGALTFSPNLIRNGDAVGMMCFVED